MPGVSAGYMQVTAEEEGSWTQDVNQLLADEQECVFALRSSGSLLLEELFSAFPGPTAAALSAAVQQRMAEAASLEVQYAVSAILSFCQMCSTWHLQQRCFDSMSVLCVLL